MALMKEKDTDNLKAILTQLTIHPITTPTPIQNTYDHTGT